MTVLDLHIQAIAREVELAEIVEFVRGDKDRASVGSTVEILPKTAANDPGAWFPIPARSKTIVIWIDGRKTIEIEGSADGKTAFPWPVVPARTTSGMHTLHDVVHYLRANPTLGAGTARVEVLY